MWLFLPILFFFSGGKELLRNFIAVGGLMMHGYTNLFYIIT